MVGLDGSKLRRSIVGVPSLRWPPAHLDVFTLAPSSSFITSPLGKLKLHHVLYQEQALLLISLVVCKLKIEIVKVNLYASSQIRKIM